MNSQLSEIEKDMTTSCQVLVESQAGSPHNTKSFRNVFQSARVPAACTADLAGLWSNRFRLSPPHVCMGEGMPSHHLRNVTLCRTLSHTLVDPTPLGHLGGLGARCGGAHRDAREVGVGVGSGFACV
ncbi:hypothetical protein E2C01_034725 [Portunus trituberculatus]|uniref:Uncharacterized protein n=1 Tax=Portunus trituberculatus TaxID=210409 RepID=A0A5B7F1B4_PORTR|nr:hypothetical protein [Portunus trituberculatus]